MKKAIFFIIISFLLTACFNETNKMNKQSIGVDLEKLNAVKIIGHKGSGDAPAYGYKDFIGNSNQSVKNAFEQVDGSEIDIQISKDSTLWVFHDHRIKACDDSSFYNISTLNDREISKMSACQYKNQLTTLNALVEEIENNSQSGKTLSLDLKVLQNKASIGLFGGKASLLRYLTKELSVFENLNNIEVLVEVPQEEDMATFLSDTKLPPYLLATNPEKITESRYNHFSADIRFMNHELRAKAKEMQLWTVNKPEEMIKAINLEADYIQTDHITLAVFFRKMLMKEVKDTLLLSKYNEKGKDEFFNLMTLDSKMLSQSYILEVSLKGLKQQSNVTYVLSGRNANGDGVIWEGTKLDESAECKKLHFINRDKLIDLDCTQLKIYLWNREKEEIYFDSLLIRKYYF